MDFYGLFLGVKDATKVIRLELNIANDDVDPGVSFDYTGDVLDVENINYFEMDASSTFRLL